MDSGPAHFNCSEQFNCTLFLHYEQINEDDDWTGLSWSSFDFEFVFRLDFSVWSVW